jgi:hypothetical protein
MFGSPFPTRSVLSGTSFYYPATFAPRNGVFDTRREAQRLLEEAKAMVERAILGS